MLLRRPKLEPDPWVTVSWKAMGSTISWCRALPFAASFVLMAAGPAGAEENGGARREPGRVDVTLEVPPDLTEGDRARVVAVVRLFSADLPLLVTPSSEGTPVEVVRGRLLRADADDPTAQPLRFRIPIVARGPGTAVVRVRVLGYACGERCTAVEAEASAVVRVARRGR